MSKVERPKYSITKNFSFPLDKNNRFGGYHKLELTLLEVDPNYPLEQQLDAALVKHVQEAANYLNTELDREIMEIKGLDKEE